jgi:hypothetical protein
LSQESIGPPSQSRAGGAGQSPYDCPSLGIILIAPTELRASSVNPKMLLGQTFRLSRRAPSVSHCYAWEAKTKAKRKLRRRRSLSPNQNPAASAKGSPQLHPSKRGNGCRHSLGRVSNSEPADVYVYCQLTPVAISFGEACSEFHLRQLPQERFGG